MRCGIHYILLTLWLLNIMPEYMHCFTIKAAIMESEYDVFHVERMSYQGLVVLRSDLPVLISTNHWRV